MNGSAGLRIGALSRLTELPPETIRTWERRYRLLDPQRDERGDRLYSMEDVERLRLISALRQRGEPISSVAELDLPSLRARLGLYDGQDEDEGLPGLDRVRVVVVHPGGGGAWDGVTRDAQHRVEVVAEAATPGGLPEPEGQRVDALVLDLLALGDDPGLWVDQLRATWQAQTVLVLYRYIGRRQRKDLLERGVRLVVAANEVEAVRLAVVEQIAADRLAAGLRPVDAGPGAPRFDRATLERLTRVDSALACECPRHVASLVLALQEFEAYARRCASESPDDAALHAELSEGTGEARGLMERLLARVCAQDGIAL